MIYKPIEPSSQKNYTHTIAEIYRYEVFGLYDNGNQFVKFFDDNDVCVTCETRDFYMRFLYQNYFLLCKEEKTHLSDSYAYETWIHKLSHSKIRFYIHKNYYSADLDECEDANQNHIIRHIIKGMSKEECVERLNNGKFFDRYYSSRSEMELFITKIYKPDFRRTPENTNKKTFDSIFIQCNINTQIDAIKFINENSNAIKLYVLDYLKEHRGFKKYGVPINILQISSVTYYKQLNILDFIFEIKKGYN